MTAISVVEERSFKYWTKDELFKKLGLIKKRKCTILEDWLKMDGMSVSNYESETLDRLLAKAVDRIDDWNELELWIKLIAPLVELVDFDIPEYYVSAFANRDLQAETENYLLNGRVDWFVATGMSNPDVPFFFLHEYKKEKGAANDPRAQLLSAMFAAQRLHQTPPEPTALDPDPIHYYKDIPIYGAYVLGRMCFFCVLKKNKYCFSNSYIMTDQAELLEIFKILKKQKAIILDLLKPYRLT